MKFTRFHLTFLILSLLALSSCSKVEEPDNRQTEYGYVQFKLYKQASAPGLKSAPAVKDELDYLSEAAKVRVTMDFNGVEIHQTLNLTAADPESAEYGLRSDKIQLLSGDYKVVNFLLYDKLDRELYRGGASSEVMTIQKGGLTVYDLFANTTPRGKVRFRLVKDESSFNNRPDTKASVEYTLSDVSYVDITVRNTDKNIVTEFKMLPVIFSIHFDDDDETFGYQTSSLQCDTLVSLIAGNHKVVSYTTYDTDKKMYEVNNSPSEAKFEIVDNTTIVADVVVSLKETAEYLKDYYALYEIWKSLDGENWSYGGENFNKGCNWDFNKDPDLWGDQPGVQIHSNGRVARLDLSEFGFKGKLPAAIGQLTELVELYLGTHNDVNFRYNDPTVKGGMNSSNRMERHKEYLSMIHVPTQFSEPIARALKEKNISIPEISLYENYTEEEIIDKATGLQKMGIKPMDMIHGKRTNGLTEIDPAIGNLKKLEMLYIANGNLKTLPEEFGNLESLTDLEIYNCSEMEELPACVGNLKSLVSFNASNNGWTPEAALRAFNTIANGKSNKKIQILYFRENNLPEVPASIRNMSSIGLLDLAYNKIEKVALFGKDIKPVQLYLDFNNISSLPTEDGIFCGFEDIETFSAQGNQFTQFPDIFSSKSNFTIVSLNFSYNNITSIENEGDGYKGVNVETLSLTNNPGITKYPVAFAQSNSKINYINLRGCSISEVPDSAFVGENVKYLNSLDLSYNHISDLPKEFNAVNIPYLYGVELSYNRFSKFPYEPFDAAGLTVFAIRAQRDENGRRCLKEWPTGMFQHTGLRGFYIGSNDLGKVTDTISHLIYYLEISDNPNIEFDASDICYYYSVGAYILIYDKTQNITGCDYM